MLTPLHEIVFAFEDCTGSTLKSLKDYLINLNILKDEYKKGYLIENVNNYILHDVEQLINKSILNILSVDLLMKKGYFSWSFITSYYSSFYILQALNRLQLRFYLYIDNRLIFEPINIINRKYILKTCNNTHTRGHQNIFSLYKRNFIESPTKALNNYWCTAFSPYKYGNDSNLRNEINYKISNKYYNDLILDHTLFKRILKENRKSPFKKEMKDIKFTNFTRSHLTWSLSRFNFLISILNYIANENLEYRSYFEKRMKERNNYIKDKYFNASDWLKIFLFDTLRFSEINDENIGKEEL